jgi:hypothetical protein
MSPKKRKRKTKEEDFYDAEELENLGIYEDEGVEDIEELDESESWRYYG